MYSIMANERTNERGRPRSGGRLAWRARPSYAARPASARHPLRDAHIRASWHGRHRTVRSSEHINTTVTKKQRKPNYRNNTFWRVYDNYRYTLYLADGTNTAARWFSLSFVSFFLCCLASSLEFPAWARCEIRARQRLRANQVAGRRQETSGKEALRIHLAKYPHCLGNKRLQGARLLPAVAAVL